MSLLLVLQPAPDRGFITPFPLYIGLMGSPVSTFDAATMAAMKQQRTAVELGLKYV